MFLRSTIGQIVMACFAYDVLILLLWFLCASPRH
jgi:hypothetical protein